MQNLVEIVAISVDDRQAVLYHRDGKITTIEQGDIRLPAIVKQAQEYIPENGFCVVDIAEPVPERAEFGAVEKGTNGLIKFFRVAKEKVKSFFEDSPTHVAPEVAHIRPIDIGIKPEDKVEEVPPTVREIEDQLEAAQVTETPVVDTIPTEVKEAVVESLSNDDLLDLARQRMNTMLTDAPTTDQAAFHTKLGDHETIVAVNTETGTMMPDAQKLAPQFEVAAKLKNYKGIENFMKRLEPVIKDRRHSVADLLKFLEKGDLPIADDGCIVIYKRLNRSGVNGDVFLDCHTGKVKQRVGSFVFMRAGLVDPNRRQDCSNGLHVASLGYLSSFSGNVTIIGKVRPEDVFAVPEHSITKMRVCGYHILGELPREVRDTVNSGRSITDCEEGRNILENVLRGNHCGVLQHVEITGQQGSGLVITDLDTSTPVSLDTAVADATAVVLDTSKDTKGEKINLITEAPVKAADLKPVVKEAEPVVEPAKGKTTDKLQTIFNEMVEAFASNFPEKAARFAQQLVDAKKSAKKSWGKLGFDEGDVQAITDCLAHKAEAPLIEKAKAKPVAVAPKEAKAKATAKPVKEKTMTVKEEAQDLYRIFKATKAKGNRADTVDAAQELQVFMSSRKKGPKAFGLDAKVSEELKLWLK